MFGTWVEVYVDVGSLRDALGLPQHDLFHHGIFHGYRHESLFPYFAFNYAADPDHQYPRGPHDDGAEARV